MGQCIFPIFLLFWWDSAAINEISLADNINSFCQFTRLIHDTNHLPLTRQGMQIFRCQGELRELRANSGLALNRKLPNHMIILGWLCLFLLCLLISREQAATDYQDILNDDAPNTKDSFPYFTFLFLLPREFIKGLFLQEQPLNSHSEYLLHWKIHMNLWEPNANM